MSDIVINQANLIDKVVKKTTPVYLVCLENGSKFIATKFDDGPNYGKFIGFYSNLLSENEVIEQLADILTNTQKSEYTEVIFPWSKINSVRNLIYKQK